MEELIKSGLDQFIEDWNPIRNKLYANAAFGNLMYDRDEDDEDLQDLLDSCDPNQIWSYKDNGTIVNAWHGDASTIGYFICQRTYNEKPGYIKYKI